MGVTVAVWLFSGVDDCGRRQIFVYARHELHMVFVQMLLRFPQGLVQHAQR